MRTGTVVVAIGGLILAALGVAPAAEAGEAAGPQQFASQAVPPARFADPDRHTRLSAAYPELDRIFREWQEKSPAPGVAYGLIVDGKLVHTGAFGLRAVAAKAPVASDSVFRIASMTKSFTALAILQLRDEGRLSLEDPVAKYVPELAALKYPTRDSPRLTIRHLLSHAAGFPEDNPWGDRQLAISPATLSAWMRAGIPFSHAPGVAYEYSNYGFAILGQVVAAVSGRPYREYVNDTIIRPLGMTATVWDAANVPHDRLAQGQRPEGTTWAAETPLADGAFGAMGGLYSSIPDLARYVAFFLDAYPPRDDPDAGPVRRASRREMQLPVSPYRGSARREQVGEPLELVAGGYGFGLGSVQTCRFGHLVSHSGGLPGFGSRMAWLPEYGVGLVVLANRTYAGLGRPTRDALEALARTGALQPRVPQASGTLLAASLAVDGLYRDWSDAALERIAADNLLLDRPLASRRKEFADLNVRLGACASGDAEAGLEVENALRGQWTLACARGRLRFSITLAPTSVPKIQFLEATAIAPVGPELATLLTAVIGHVGGTVDEPLAGRLAPGADAAALGRTLSAARPWGTCNAGEVLAGDGESAVTVRLACEHGVLEASLAVDRDSHRLTTLRLAPSADQFCVP